MPDDPMLKLSNIEIERALLQGLFIYPEEVPLIDLDPLDFYDRRHQTIFETMREMDNAREAIDLETMHNRLIAKKCLDNAGGFIYLVEIHAGYGIAKNPVDYASAVAELATRRRVFREAQDLARAVLDRQNEISEVIGRFSNSLPRLIKQGGSVQHISYWTSRHYERIKEAQENPEEIKRRMMQTGFLDFDAATLGGLRSGELLLLYGKPGLGKTKFAHQLGAQLAFNGYPGAIFQCETSEEEIMDREFSRETKIPTERLEAAELNDEEWVSYIHALEKLSAASLPLYLDFKGGWNTTSLRATLTRMKAEHQLRWFIVDYLKFLTDNFGADETERENNISIQLKRICRDLDLTGVVIHSMNKKGMSADAPELEDGSGGAGISFDCDKAIFMVEHLPEDPDAPRHKHYRTLLIRKSRRKLARKGFHLQAMDGYPAFVDVAPDDQQEPPARRKAPATPRINHHEEVEDG